MKQKQILVTGGTGFIGNHLCRELVKDSNNYVICLDNNSTGKMQNISDLLNYTNFEFYRHDVTMPLYLEVDEIYHLACPASPAAYQRNGIKTIKTNIVGTLHMLGVAKRTKARILLSSTSEVYGDPTISPQSESYFGNVNPVGPRACYDEGKRASETLMIEYHRHHNVDIRIARIFNTYGPTMDPKDGRVVSNFINQSLNGENITIYGDGSQTRSFCYVEDMVRGLIKLMMNNTVTGPVNLGNPDEWTILNLANYIREKTKSKSEIQFRELPENDPLQRCPDISKARNILNWEPLIKTENGIDKTIEYFSRFNN